ncbi:MAG TPA: beta-N-acetylhexosaminidase [Candidatus Paceibacterota bacterium]|nr:beta-N-acetylglucosaminidase [Limisphaerales bacterium]HQE89274.1 beta-N-acetylhexosaminidase [Verrucomicrobiota bacterium]HQH01774.1 beta-N-acetylhexosaminidase [Verrucomicrobiota bacterium]HRY57336.1 beta-N-acetylhexosaminidase [Candidatus Paceibacterota bacterium]HRZ69044.1 beta-N-acetylhexosaminidase [Candidatus Paceibacterota bacterium]
MNRLIALMLLSLTAGHALAAGDSPALIPAPRKLECREGTFNLHPKTHILADRASQDTARYLAERLRQATGYKLKTTLGTEPRKAKGAIILTTQEAKAALGPEGYELIVAPDEVALRASGQAGMFYGVQSLLQLLPPQIFAAKPEPGQAWQAPCVWIEDQPRFKWRGVLFDTARHFFPKAEVKQLLDVLALHKVNMLQLHLTDDQGWRVEIGRYPRLTQVGAWRDEAGFGLDPKLSTTYGPDGRYGGYYTKADIWDIVAYAAARHITVVPEIEMPGHASAALAAHPELSCSGGPYTPNAKGGVFAGVYCAGREETFEFLQNVLAEVCELFPGKYIHIGGDEVPKDNWKQCPRCQARIRQEGLEDERELQSYFIRRIEKFINAQGRTLIGWSEIREGGLAQNAVVMDWIGGAAEAASTGHDVIMSPTSHCYLDYYQSTNHATEPKAIGGYVPLSKVYAFEPIPPNLAPAHQSRLLGAQGNLWTEYIPNFKHAQYMLFPRLCALAEVVWSPPGARNWEDFLRRLPVQFQRFDQLGVNYRKGTPERIGE